MALKLDGDDEAALATARPSPFEPPGPPEPSALETAGTVAGGIAVIGALVAVDTMTCGLLSALGGLPGGEGERQPIDVRALEQAMPGLAQTGAPRRTADGRVLCSRCSTAVPFATMSLNEHGYFCRACADALAT